jgi:two-component system cell cycle sensor histidine kinase/response regulator CckA
MLQAESAFKLLNYALSRGFSNNTNSMEADTRHDKNAASLSLVTQSVLLTAVYFLGGLLGHAGSFMSGEVALIWPPAGIAVAAILLFGYRFWPGVAAGALLFSTISGKPLGFFTVATAVGNTISAITCAHLLGIAGFRNSISRLRDATAFILLAAAIGTAINAAFNVVGLCYSNLLSWNDMFPALLDWWVPNALGTLLVAPLLLAWASPSRIQWKGKRLLELGLCVAGLGLSCAISFDSWLFHGLKNYPMAFLPFPFLVWAALRFEQRGGATAAAIVAACAIIELHQHRGPFFTGNEITSLMLIGCYIGIASGLNILLAGSAMERDEAHRLLSISEKQYRGVVEDQFDLICRFKPDGTLTFANDAYCRSTEKTRKELIGSNYFEELSERDREIPLAVFHALLPERDHVSFDNRTFLHDRILWQQVTVRALFDDDNEISEFQAVMQDVTERKESEERLKAVLENMMVGVIVVSPPGHISSINPAAERIFSRKAAELVGQPTSTLFSISDAAVFEEHLSKSRGLRTQTKFLELGALAPNGQTMPIEVAVTETTVCRFQMQIILVRDITERKQLEMQSQKMEAIGRLTGGIAHDFRNLTQAVLGFTDLLLQRMPAHDGNREIVTQVQRSVEHANSLTRQLLGFSRKRVVERKVVGLNNVVADMNKLLKRVIGEMIRLDISLTDAPAYVHADAGQLQQIVMNLAINARDAMAGTGELKIQTAVVELDEDADDGSHLKAGSYATLRIEDTGCGMHPEVLARIFEPFFTTKDANQGTGLGLAIVQDIVQLSGGEIAVDSTPGRGTSFTIYLPLAPAPAVEVVTPVAIPTKTGGTETILLVEDEELVRMMLVEVLTAKGYNVLANGCGMSALAESHSYQGTIHLLITDLMLPELPGWQLADRIAKTRGATPVLFMSGYTSEEIAQKTKGRHGIDFLQKPFNNEALLIKVRQILDSKLPR